MNFKKNILQFSYTVYNVYVMFYYEILWFYQDFKIENLNFLNLYSVHAARVLELLIEVMLSAPRRRTNHLDNSNGFSFNARAVTVFLYFRSQIH